MAEVTVGVREDYIKSDATVAITKNGRRVGTFVRAPRRPTDADRQAFQEASDAVKAMMDAAGITEEDINAEADRALLEDKLARRAAR
jgi:hypothetical protein